MTKRYIPETGDIVRIHFDLAAGAGPAYKLALVLSPAAYNKKTGLMVCCPLVDDIKGYPFEVTVESEGQDPNTALAALSDQVKSLDWFNSKITRQAKAGSADVAQVKAKLHALLFKG